MSDEAQYDEWGSAFDADLESEEYGDPDLGVEADVKAFAGQDPARVEREAVELLADFPELGQTDAAIELRHHARLAAEELGTPSLRRTSAGGGQSMWRAAAA